MKNTLLLFDMNIGDESTSTFKDIFDCIDDDGSKEISFDEFNNFINPLKNLQERVKSENEC